MIILNIVHYSFSQIIPVVEARDEDLTHSGNPGLRADACFCDGAIFITGAQ